MTKVKSDYSPEEPVLAGSGGNELWTFKGIHTGTDTIRLIYIRPRDLSTLAGSRDIIVEVELDE